MPIHHRMNHLLDVARGAYSRLPPGTRSRLGRFMRIVPESLKWGSTYRKWRARISAAGSNPELARAQQDAARVAVVNAALRQSTYYRELFTSVLGAKFQPQDALDAQTWARIPVLTSATVAERAAGMCTCPPAQLDTGSTGGTSGKPVKFYLGRHRSPIEYAFVHDAWSRAGYRAGDARCVFRGVELLSDARHMNYDAGFAELRCSVFHLTDAVMGGYCEEIRRRRIRFIHGYPSAIAIFASFMLRAGLAPLPWISGVFPTSERLYPGQRDIIMQAFAGATVVPFYGLSEKVAFACARKDDLDVYEFDPLYGYAELLDDDGVPVTTPGAAGRIVSTGLLFPGMPFIRYETGDSAELVAQPCADNGHRLAVRGITPKHGTEFFVGRSGILLAVKGIISNLQGTASGIREYQFYQDTPGEAVVRIVPLGPAAADFSGYQALLNRKTGGELHTVVEVVDRIPLSPRGKRKFIDQRLKMPSPVVP
jgi:phenylacetate-CoA ligase